jgi:nitroreductase
MDMQEKFETVKETIQNRRTTGPAIMNGEIIPEEQIKELLKLADWAPTHGYTEPWRYFIFSGERLKNFSKAHADMYWENTPEEARDDSKYKKLLHNTEKVSHLLVVAMKRGSNPRIPAMEEYASVAASIQNLLIGATALGIASMWNTGGMALHPAMKTFLGLGEEDNVLGLIYLGYSNQPMEGRRKTPFEEKFTWK